MKNIIKFLFNKEGNSYYYNYAEDLYTERNREKYRLVNPLLINKNKEVIEKKIVEEECNQKELKRIRTIYGKYLNDYYKNLANKYSFKTIERDAGEIGRDLIKELLRNSYYPKKIFLKGSTGINVLLELEGGFYKSKKLNKKQKNDSFIKSLIKQNNRIIIEKENIINYLNNIRAYSTELYKLITLAILTNNYNPIFEGDLYFMAIKNEEIKNFAKEALEVLRIEKLPVLDYDNLLENLEIDINYSFDSNEEKGLVIPSVEIYSEIKKEISSLNEENLEQYVKKCCGLINFIIKY